MKFRNDIDPATTWVVSDTHFGHDNIVGFCHRPEDHEQVMVAEWRRAVPDDATVLHLGDLCYKGNARFKNITAKELTGARKVLVMGNHDKQRFSFYRDCGFKVWKPFAIRYSGRPLLCRACDGEGWVGGMLGETCHDCEGRAVLDYPWVVSFSHYPWSNEEEGRRPDEDDLRIHGHIHNNGYSRDAFVPFLRNHINLSLEQTRYTPVNLKVLLDAVLLGTYPETTDEQMADARQRKEANRP